MNTILFVDHDYGFSGSTISLIYLVRSFVDAGYKVFVLTPKGPKDRLCYEQYGALCISSLVAGHSFLRLGLHFTDTITLFSRRGPSYFMQEAIRLVVGFFASLFAIAKVKPDIVYINEYVSLQALFAARLLGKKTVVQVRSPFVRGMFGLRRWLLAKSLAWFGHGVFAITEYEKKQIQDISRHTAHVHVVREFLSLENFTIAIDVAAEKKNLGLPLDKKIVLMVGGIYDIKGTLDFLHAAELVLAHRSDVYFVVAGKEYDMDPAYFAECKRFAGLPHIKDSFAFKGEVLNLVDYVTCCTMLVSSNTLTHFSRPVIEAWAQKKPVVATDMEHSKYLIEHNSDGLIVKVFDHGQMADAIETLLDNEEMAGRFGENGYAKARRDYDAKKNTGTILALCNEILGITQVA